MEVQFDRAAMLAYQEDMEGVSTKMRRAMDESMGQYQACGQTYTRLYTELEQLLRNAVNKMDAAESLQRSADEEMSSAERMMTYSEDGYSRDAAHAKMAQAQSMREQAAEELAQASAEYEKAQNNLNALTEVWERYRPGLDAAAGQVEDGFSSFSSVAGSGNRGLNDYMAAMEKARAALYDDAGAAAAHSAYDTKAAAAGVIAAAGVFAGGRTLAATGAAAASDAVSATGNLSVGKQFSASGRDAAFSGNAECASEKGEEVFRTEAGNTLRVSSSDGASQIIMTFGSETHTFPGTKTGCAKAYRTAQKYGDPEMIRQTDAMFTHGIGACSAGLPENRQYVVDTLSRLRDGLTESENRDMLLAGAEMRKMRAPSELTAAGKVRGRWRDSVFYPDDDFVPSNMNDGKLTVAELKQDLQASYGLKLEGIPFVHGAADFSSLSIAAIPAKEIVMQVKGISSSAFDALEAPERTELFSEVFDKSRRNANFSLADKLTAERQVPIPGLSPGYTASDLTAWRSDSKHHFTWDEQVRGGYCLVPSVIHANIPHTGLVSSPAKAAAYLRQREKDPPEKYSRSEDDAPVSIDEYLAKQK